MIILFDKFHRKEDINIVDKIIFEKEDGNNTTILNPASVTILYAKTLRAMFRDGFIDNNNM